MRSRNDQSGVEGLLPDGDSSSLNGTGVGTGTGSAPGKRGANQRWLVGTIFLAAVMLLFRRSPGLQFGGVPHKPSDAPPELLLLHAEEVAPAHHPKVLPTTASQEKRSVGGSSQHSVATALTRRTTLNPVSSVAHEEKEEKDKDDTSALQKAKNDASSFVAKANVDNGAARATASTALANTRVFEKTNEDAERHSPAISNLQVGSRFFSSAGDDVNAAAVVPLKVPLTEKGASLSASSSTARSSTVSSLSTPSHLSLLPLESELADIEKLGPCRFAHGRSLQDKKQQEEVVPPFTTAGDQGSSSENRFRLRFSQVSFTFEPHRHRNDDGDIEVGSLELSHGDVCRPKVGAMTSSGQMKDDQGGHAGQPTSSEAMASSNAAGLYGCPLTCLRVSGPPWCINDNDINDNGEGDRSSTNEGGSEEVKKQQQLESHQSQRQLEPCRLTSASKLKRAQETHSRAEADAIKSVDDREVELAKQKHNLPSFLKTTIATEAGEELDKWKATHFFACFDSGESYGAAWFATRHSVFRRRVSPGPREHMETAGSLGLPPSNTPLKTVDLLDFSVEHLSWLERRIGLRYLTGALKTALHQELTQHMRLREALARNSALKSLKLRTKKRRQLRLRKRRNLMSSSSLLTPTPTLENISLNANNNNNNNNNSEISDRRRRLLLETNDGDGDGDKDGDEDVNEDDDSLARGLVVAVFPYFATNNHCNETGQALSKEEQSSTGGARCDSGSSDPLMRRYFLNLTFWTVHKTITPNIVLSVCSDEDEDFARHRSGLPFFHVFRSDCRVYSPEFGQVIFKPGLLGVLTVMRLQEHFRDDPSFKKFRYVYYNEADQVVHSRLSVKDLIQATIPSSSKVDHREKSLGRSSKAQWPHPYVVPHRLQPISDPVDLPSLSNPSLTKGNIAKWVFDDVARVQAAHRFHFPPSEPPPYAMPNNNTNSSSSNGGGGGNEGGSGGGGGNGHSNGGSGGKKGAMVVVHQEGQGSCCLDRGECKTRKHWKAWKVSPAALAQSPEHSEHLGVFKVGASLTMVAGEGDYGNLLFRKCIPSPTRLQQCP